jgi:hypothetical protein
MVAKVEKNTLSGLGNHLPSWCYGLEDQLKCDLDQCTSQ